MSSARPFPLDHAPADPTPDRAGRRATRSAGAAVETAPPLRVLARIEQLTPPPRSPHDPSPRHEASVGATPAYRYDQPHAAASPSWKHTAPPAERPPFAKHDLRPESNLPMAIRLAVQAWQASQPYRPLLRFAAIVALAAAGGMSMTMMLNGRAPRTGAAANTSTTATAADQGKPAEPSPHPDQFDPAPQLHPAAAPDASTSLVAPSAIGPGVATADRPERIAREPVVAPAAGSAYPTTPYPETAWPGVGDGALPQVRTTEPPASVARLQGYIQEPQPR